MNILSKTAFFRFATVFYISVYILQISAQAGPPDYKKMSEDEIQKMLLKEVPLGSSSDTVRAYLKAKTGKDPWFQTNFPMYVKNPVPGASPDYVEKHFDGLATAVIGSYGFFIFTTYVNTDWEFDSHLRLINVTVTKKGGEMP
jgi:hypothetical protein